MTAHGAAVPENAPEPLRFLEPKALEELRSGVHLMALHRLGDADAAEEVVQESLARVLSALHDASTGGPAVQNLGAFVHGIARHVISDALRRQRRQVTSDTLTNAPDPGILDDALSRAVSAEEHALVRHALARLSESDRRIIQLSFYEGLTPGQVAARTGEPPERIRKRKSRALERLRRVFLGSGGAREPEGPDTPVITGPTL